MLDQYETLRSEVAAGDPMSGRGHGRALFLARGMAAWMMALQQLTPPVEVITIEFHDEQTPPIYPEARSALTALLADMVLVCNRSKP
jgi:hypothetical protein